MIVKIPIKIFFDFLFLFEVAEDKGTKKLKYGSGGSRSGWTQKRFAGIFPRFLQEEKNSST